MSKDGIINEELWDYWDVIVRLAKCYLKDYLQEIVKEGPGVSERQHLFQDTLLSKEVTSFLSDAADFHKDHGLFLIDRAAPSTWEGKLYPLEYLSRVFDLNYFECFCMTLLASSAMNQNFKKVYSYLNNDLRKENLSVGMAMEMTYGKQEVSGDYKDFFLRGSKLCKFLIDLDRPSGCYLIEAGMKLKPAIEEFLYDTNRECPELKSLVRYYIPGEELPEILTEEKPYVQMMEYFLTYLKESSRIFYLYGAPGIGKKLNVKYLAKQLNTAVIFFHPEKLINDEIELYPLLQTLLTEIIIKKAILCICSNSRNLAEDENTRGIIVRTIDFMKSELPLIILTSDSTNKASFCIDGIELIPIKISADSLEENHRFWTEMAKGYQFEEGFRIEDFTANFLLTPGQMKEIIEDADRLTKWHHKEKISQQFLRKACYEKLEHQLGRKAQKVNILYNWDDLVLPDYQLTMLKMACNQVIYRYKVFSEWGYSEKMAYGKGLSILFSGSPGTGKTMAAQVIAGELGFELYKIELATVISKYIGETERNLNEIFEEAKKSQAIIFFDEADVLFSKRSEVKDSNDKYSNMEAAFMLQKIEEYSGIVILATNFQQNIDEAFKRRITFLIDFPFPDQMDRKKIWLRVFPGRLPLSNDIDFDFIAEKFELSGSNIRNVALNAAYLAASEGKEVSMKHIIKAVVNEFAKSGKKLSKEELGEYNMYS